MLCRLQTADLRQTFDSHNGNQFQVSGLRCTACHCRSVTQLLPFAQVDGAIASNLPEPTNFDPISAVEQPVKPKEVTGGAMGVCGCGSFSAVPDILL